jgi:dsRNA-specific ribonuclease
VEVVVEGETLARGIGLTKKAAEQAAAREALERVWSAQSSN